MVLFAVVLVCWLLLTLPAAVLMGKCISRGLEPAAGAGASPRLPQQRAATEDETEPASAQAGRSQA